jgi:2-oxoglutarate ferredoxin oxidoreductase subunit alpha
VSRLGLPRSLSLRIAGDAGDGIPFLGQQLAQLLARTVSSLLLLADPPAEIRAPAGMLSAALAYQVRCGAGVTSVREPLDLLIALSPAALQLARAELAPGALLLLHAERFTNEDLPSQDDPLWANYQVWPLPITSWNRTALAARKLSHPESDRCQNFFVLGLLAWMLALPLDPVQEWLQTTFVRKPEMAEASERSLLAGWAQAREIGLPRLEIPVGSPPAPGLHRLLSGVEALTLGMLTAAHQAQRSLLVAACAAPATAELLAAVHEVACDRLVAMASEDEAGAIGAALGAAFGGSVGIALSSGPGLSVQSELLGLAVLAELPLVLVHVQHGGPALALPRHVEQADLAAALHGRTGDAPLVVLAQATPAEGVELLSEAVHLATEWMTSVVVLSDVHLLHMSDIAIIPELLPDPHPESATADTSLNRLPHQRDHRGVRPWVLPGTAGREHCLSGLETAPEGGRVSFDPDDHARQCQARSARLEALQTRLPLLSVEGNDTGTLLLGWGSTFGPLREAVGLLRQRGHPVAHAHLRHLQPLPPNLATVLARYHAVLVVELNEGQLAAHLRATLGIGVQSLARMGGALFSVAEIVTATERFLGSVAENRA